jgi:predicted nucleic acid-binding protein
MIIVSDTSPISNLIQIKQLDLLQKLYKQVLIPRSVYNELIFLDYQKIVLEFETWIKVYDVKDQNLLKEIVQKVDIGEAEAMVLAIELKADYLLIDEQKGRMIAEEYGIVITGILGVLVKAKQENLISSVKVEMEGLRDIAGFRIHPNLFETILRLVGE